MVYRFMGFKIHPVDQVMLQFMQDAEEKCIDQDHGPCGPDAGPPEIAVDANEQEAHQEDEQAPEILVFKYRVFFFEVLIRTAYFFPDLAGLLLMCQNYLYFTGFAGILLRMLPALHTFYERAKLALIHQYAGFLVLKQVCSDFIMNDSEDFLYFRDRKTYPEMVKNKLITVCIPCYNNPGQIKFLLQNLATQRFEDFDVVVTDNSTNDEIEQLMGTFSEQLDISYYRNETNIGAVPNWNKAIALATGEWIKIMHSDDFFTDEDSLSGFAAHTRSGATFLFSDFSYLHEATGRIEHYHFPEKKLKDIYSEPMILNGNNLIGNPSATMIHKSLKQVIYDPRFTWKVDIQYFISLIKAGAQLLHISKGLVTIGMNEHQLTRKVKTNPEFEIPESYYMLEAFGFESLNNINVYDAYWRVYRSLGIYDLATIRSYHQADWGPVLEHLFRNLSQCKPGMLKQGWYSKLMMFKSYLTRPR